LKSKPLPSIEYLRSRIELGDDGIARWLPFKGNGFKPEWIGQPIGRVFESSPGALKRKFVTLERGRFLLSRIVYALATGQDPGPLHVDHINGDSLDDRPLNLRSATNSQNLRNRRGPQVNSKLGARNVYRHIRGGFFVTVGHKYGGYFKNFEDAEQRASQLRLAEFGAFAGQNVRERVSRG
jgi:hypothetical protein